MKCIIVDDEPLAREGMVLNVEEVEFLELIGTFENAIKANEFLQSNEVDLIFLDINMPGLSGLDFIRGLEYQPSIILSTAYPQYALESYELGVVDYLTKPIRFERFLKAAKKAKELFELKHGVEEMEEETPIAEPNEDFIYVRSDRKLVRLHYDDIQYIKGLKDYVEIHTAKGKLLTAMNIKTVFSQLPPTVFARISKSYIINTRVISEIHSDFLKIDSEEIPIGKTYKEEFFSRFVDKKIVDRN